MVLLHLLATSNGEESNLETRKVSGDDGSCKKHHMKLHIYVCVPSKGKNKNKIFFSFFLRAISNLSALLDKDV